MQTYESILAEHPFFKGLDPGIIRAIAACAEEECFDPGTVIFRYGEESKRFYLIEHGRVALEVAAPDRGAITIQTIDEGDIFGASWLFPPYRCQYEAVVVEFTRTLSFNAECLRATCEEDHDIGYELMKRFATIMVQRLHETRMQLLDMYASPASPKGR